jgi:HEAT repeats
LREMLSWGRGHVRDGSIALQTGRHAMFDFLKSMIGKRGMPLTEAESSLGKEIAVDLGRLATISPDLAQRTIAYVLTDENGSVLLQLEQQAKSVQAALSQFQPTVVSAADKAAVQAAIKARNDVLSRAHGPSATYIRRYLEVLTLPLKGTRWGLFSYQGPSPFWLRGLFALNEIGLYAGQRPTELTTALSWRDEDQSATVLALDLLVLEKSNTYYFRNHNIGSRFDFNSGLAAERPAVIEAFARYDRPGQAIVIQILKQFDLVKDDYFDFIYQQYLLSTSKAVREAAQNALLASPPQALSASATKTLAEGNPTARAQAAQILSLVMGERARSLLGEHLTKETSKTVRKVIELGLGSAVVDDGAAQTARTLKEDGADGNLAADGTEVLTPAPVAVPGPTPLPDSVNAGYRNLLDKAYAQQVKNHELQKERYASANAEQRKNYWKSGPPQLPARVDHGIADRYCALLASDDPIDEATIAKIGNFNPFAPYNKEAAASPPFSDPEMTLWHLCRARNIEACRTKNPNWLVRTLLSGHGAIPAAIHARLVNGLDLRSMTTLLQFLEPKELAIQILSTGTPEDLPAALMWPYLAAHFDVLDQALGQVAAKDFREPPIYSALTKLSLFPKLPARYFNTVLTHALSSKKTINKPARALLLDIDGIEQRLLPFLSDSKQDVRSGVAEMLGVIGSEGAIEPLKTALGKEKSELVRASLLGALRRLQVDISSYVSPEILIKEAVAGLKSRKVKDIAWFPLQTLPALSWANGGAMPSDVPRWWIALAGKLAQAGGNALFSLWLDQFAPESAEALGRHILGSFLRYDAAHCSEEEANAHAKANAQQRYEQFQDYAKRWNNEFYRSYTYEKAFADLRAAKLAIYLNNAQADRGILGLMRC